MVRQTPPFHVCVYVLLAPPSVLGVWFMALVLWLPTNPFLGIGTLMHYLMP